ncbi:MAG: 50S ribosomal protein L24 [Patescibacteria group bacterium]
MKIKKDDNVVVITGKDRGKTGKVLQVLPRAEKVVVQALNMRTLHRRPRRQGEKGQTLSKESPLAASNVMLVCGKCARPTRVGYRVDESGKKSRICKRCGTIA